MTDASTGQTSVAEVRDLLVPIEKLILDPANARKHSRRNLETIMESLQAFGQRKPLVMTPDYVIRAGNGTLESMREMTRENLELEQIGGGPRWRHFGDVWVSVFPGTPAEARAYAIADNRTAELAEWDPDTLIDQLTALDQAMQLAAGYSPGDVSDLVDRFTAAPDLDALAQQYGAPDERVLWPVLRIAVPRPLLEHYHRLTDPIDGEEHEKFGQLLAMAEAGRAQR